jgi:hypothetical protein
VHSGGALASPDTLPEAVSHTRRELRSAAFAKDYGRLRALVDSDFTYTFGPETPGGPIAYWRRLDEASRTGDEKATSDEGPTWLLARLLQVPPAFADGHYVWPFWVSSDPGALDKGDWNVVASTLYGPGPTPSEEDVVARYWADGSYVGPRTAITPDGQWMYFVAGD